MKVLVTGGTGFIGSHLIDRLIRDGLNGRYVDVSCLSDRPDAVVARWGNKVQVLAGRLNSLPEHRAFLQTCDYVFHLAAAASLTSHADFATANIEGTRCLLDALKGSTALRRLVFTSTIGAVDRKPDDHCDRLLDETFVCHPLSEYGRTKRVCEEMLASSSLPWSIVRPTWVYGPGMRKDSHLRVFVSMVQSGGLASWFHFPGRVSIIHIDDLIDSLLLTARDDRAIHQTYFVSDDCPVAIGDLFRELGEFDGNVKAGRIRCSSWVIACMRAVRRWLPLTVQNLFSDVLCADASKLMALGYRPSVLRERGLLQTLRWHNEAGQRHAKKESHIVTVITGAAGGLGSSLAKQLFAAGHHVLLIDKDADKLACLATLLNARYLALDLTLEASLQRVASYLTENGLALGCLINNAGAGVRGAVDSIAFDRQCLSLDLNCRALTYLSRLAIEEFRKTGQGVLVNIASSSAFQPLPFMAVYAASKAYVLQFSRALTGELLDAPGIQVLTVNPAGIDTGFQSAAGVKRNPREKLLSPWHVASQICRAIQSGKSEITIGRTAKLMAMMGRVVPAGLQVRLWRQLMGAMR